MAQFQESIGPYTLIKALGEGEYGGTWVAEKRTTVGVRRFALKIPWDEQPDLDALWVERDTWARAGGQPNVLPPLEADLCEGCLIIVRKYVPEGSLEDWLLCCGEAPYWEDAASLTLGILAGLAHLHSFGLAHGNLKPSNILLQKGVPRLTDYGLPMVLRVRREQPNLAGYRPNPFYGTLTPEGADLWMAAAIFHRLLTGRPPFPSGASARGAFPAGNLETSLPPSVPPALCRFLGKALDFSAARRWPTALSMRGALEDALGESWQEGDKSSSPVAGAVENNTMGGLADEALPDTRREAPPLPSPPGKPLAQPALSLVPDLDDDDSLPPPPLISPSPGFAAGPPPPAFLFPATTPPSTAPLPPGRGMNPPAAPYPPPVSLGIRPAVGEPPPPPAPVTPKISRAEPIKGGRDLVRPSPPGARPAPRRPGLSLAAVAGLALLIGGLGFGLALWLTRPGNPAPPPSPNAAASPVPGGTTPSPAAPPSAAAPSFGGGEATSAGALEQGKLTIRVNLDNARVQVDGEDKGVASTDHPLTIPGLPVGTVMVQAQTESGERAEMAVRVIGKDETVVSLTLVKETALSPAGGLAGSEGVVSDGERFVVFRHGEVLDKRSGLMWAGSDNGRDLNWPEASAFCRNCQNGGHSDWRLPSVAEIKAFLEARTPGRSSFSGSYLWTSDQRSNGTLAAGVSPGSGESQWFPILSGDGFRVLAVRKFKP